LVRIIIIVVAILLNLVFILKKEIGVLQKISIIGVVSVIINVAIIGLTFILGFSTKINGINVNYRGITGIKWENINWFASNGWSSFS
jgi:hypothetical protein